VSNVRGVLEQDRYIQRVYRLCDIYKTQLIPPDQAGEVYLEIESARPDTKHHRDSRAHADGEEASFRGCQHAIRRSTATTLGLHSARRIRFNSIPRVFERHTSLNTDR